MQSTGRWARALSFLLALSLGAADPEAQQQAAVPDVQKLGPQVGTAVPGLSLTDQTGRTRTLQSLMGPKGMILVFFRSADW